MKPYLSIDQIIAINRRTEAPISEWDHQAAVDAIKTANANCDLARARAHAAVRLLHKAFSISPSATTAAKVARQRYLTRSSS